MKTEFYHIAVSIEGNSSDAVESSFSFTFSYCVPKQKECAASGYSPARNTQVSANLVIARQREQLKRVQFYFSFDFSSMTELETQNCNTTIDAREISTSKLVKTIYEKIMCYITEICPLSRKP